MVLDHHSGDNDNLSGKEVFSWIHNDSFNLVLISNEEDPVNIKVLIDSGVSGIVPDSYSHEVMLAAIKLILLGETFIPADKVYKMIPSNTEKPINGMCKKQIIKNKCKNISNRQVEIILLVSKGYSNKKIASELCISEGTVKAHLHTAFRNMEVSNRAEVVRFVSNLNILIE